MSSWSSDSILSEDIDRLDENPEDSRPIDIPTPYMSRPICRSAGAFSYNRPGNDEHVDFHVDFHVDNTIAGRVRRALRAVRPSLRIDRPGAPLGRRGTPPPSDIQDRAAAPNRERLAQANYELHELMNEERAADPTRATRATRARRAAVASSRLAPPTRTMPSSSHLSRVVDPVLPVRPLSPPVPTTEGRRRFQRIPVREGENDEVVRLVPLIGRIEDLVEYPSPDPSPQASAVLRPVEPLLSDIMDRRFNMNMPASAVASSSASTSRASGGARIIPFVIEEDQPAKPTDQPRRSPLTGPRAAMMRAVMDQMRSWYA